jgi:[protein-PII] uridylyltransferase
METTLCTALADPNFVLEPLLERARRKLGTHANRDVDFPTKITTDNRAHPSYTLIQIETADRLGLLHDLLCVFGRERVSIALSRISTEKGGAVDTFYVADELTRSKITDANRIASLQSELQHAALRQR